MDDGSRCLLDVINDPTLLRSFLESGSEDSKDPQDDPSSLPSHHADQLSSSLYRSISPTTLYNYVLDGSTEGFEINPESIGSSNSKLFNYPISSSGGGSSDGAAAAQLQNSLQHLATSGGSDFATFHHIPISSGSGTSPSFLSPTPSASQSSSVPQSSPLPLLHTSTNSTSSSPSPMSSWSQSNLVQSTATVHASKNATHLVSSGSVAATIIQPTKKVFLPLQSHSAHPHLQQHTKIQQTLGSNYPAVAGGGSVVQIIPTPKLPQAIIRPNIQPKILPKPLVTAAPLIKQAPQHTHQITHHHQASSPVVTTTSQRATVTVPPSQVVLSQGPTPSTPQHQHPPPPSVYAGPQAPIVLNQFNLAVGQSPILIQGMGNLQGVQLALRPQGTPIPTANAAGQSEAQSNAILAALQGHGGHAALFTAPSPQGKHLASQPAIVIPNSISTHHAGLASQTMAASHVSNPVMSSTPPSPGLISVRPNIFFAAPRLVNPGQGSIQLQQIQTCQGPITVAIASGQAIAIPSLQTTLHNTAAFAALPAGLVATNQGLISLPSQQVLSLSSQQSSNQKHNLSTSTPPMHTVISAPTTPSPTVVKQSRATVNLAELLKQHGIIPESSPPPSPSSQTSIPEQQHYSESIAPKVAIASLSSHSNQTQFETQLKASIKQEHVQLQETPPLSSPNIDMKPSIVASPFFPSSTPELLLSANSQNTVTTSINHSSVIKDSSVITKNSNITASHSILQDKKHIITSNTSHCESAPSKENIATVTPNSIFLPLTSSQVTLPSIALSGRLPSGIPSTTLTTARAITYSTSVPASTVPAYPTAVIQKASTFTHHANRPWASSHVSPLPVVTPLSTSNKPSEEITNTSTSSNLLSIISTSSLSTDSAILSSSTSSTLISSPKVSASGQQFSSQPPTRMLHLNINPQTSTKQTQKQINDILSSSIDEAKKKQILDHLGFLGLPKKNTTLSQVAKNAVVVPPQPVISQPTVETSVSSTKSTNPPSSGQGIHFINFLKAHCPPQMFRVVSSSSSTSSTNSQPPSSSGCIMTTSNAEAQLLPPSNSMQAIKVVRVRDGNIQRQHLVTPIPPMPKAEVRHPVSSSLSAKATVLMNSANQNFVQAKSTQSQPLLPLPHIISHSHHPTPPSNSGPNVVVTATCTQSSLVPTSSTAIVLPQPSLHPSHTPHVVPTPVTVSQAVTSSLKLASTSTPNVQVPEKRPPNQPILVRLQNSSTTSIESVPPPPVSVAPLVPFSSVGHHVPVATATVSTATTTVVTKSVCQTHLHSSSTITTSSSLPPLVSSLPLSTSHHHHHVPLISHPKQEDSGVLLSCPHQTKTLPKIPMPKTSAIVRAQRIQNQLYIDQDRVLNPDTNTPFQSKEDACKRLLSYHLYNTAVPSEEELLKEDETFEKISNELLAKKQFLITKFNQLLLKGSMKLAPSSELVMLEQSFFLEEQELLHEDRKAAAEGKFPLDFLRASSALESSPSSLKRSCDEMEDDDDDKTEQDKDDEDEDDAKKPRLVKYLKEIILQKQKNQDDYEEHSHTHRLEESESEEEDTEDEYEFKEDDDGESESYSSSRPKNSLQELNDGPKVVTVKTEPPPHLEFDDMAKLRKELNMSPFDDRDEEDTAIEDEDLNVDYEPPPTLTTEFSSPLSSRHEDATPPLLTPYDGSHHNQEQDQPSHQGIDYDFADWGMSSSAIMKGESQTAVESILHSPLDSQEQPPELEMISGFPHHSGSSHRRASSSNLFTALAEECYPDLSSSKFLPSDKSSEPSSAYFTDLGPYCIQDADQEDTFSELDISQDKMLQDAVNSILS